MNSCTSRIVTVCTVALSTFVYACVLSEDTSTDEQANTNLNSPNLNGSSMNGSSMNGMSLLAFQFDGATHGGEPLTNLRVENGELKAEKDAVPLAGTGLQGAVLQGMARDITVSSELTTATFEITNVVQESASYDPTGSTYLYTIVMQGTGGWSCQAIPVAAEWDETGNRTDDSSRFTLACTTGVIAKCYRWGYRPWIADSGTQLMEDMHWTCTRLARADWCGDGVPHTTDGTLINVWDNLPTQIQTYGTPPGGLEFDSGWNTSGATCLSSNRWGVSGSTVESLCPAKLGTGAGRITCNSEGSAPGGSTMFKEMDIVP